MYMYVYVCMYVCIYIYIYIYAYDERLVLQLRNENAEPVGILHVDRADISCPGP